MTFRLFPNSECHFFKSQNYKKICLFPNQSEFGKSFFIILTFKKINRFQSFSNSIDAYENGENKQLKSRTFKLTCV